MCVASTQKLNCVDNHDAKCENVDKIHSKHVANLKMVGAVPAG
jgi:hypothetical protein